MKPKGEGKGFNLWDTSPLSDVILNYPFPDKFNMPPLGSYDGWTNPVSYVNTYRLTIHLQFIKDSILYKVFLTTLKRVTQ